MKRRHAILAVSLLAATGAGSGGARARSATVAWPMHLLENESVGATYCPRPPHSITRPDSTLLGGQGGATVAPGGEALHRYGQSIAPDTTEATCRGTTVNALAPTSTPR